MSLTQQTLSGVKWSATSQFGRQGIQFVTVAILARLLTPDDFGLIGMTMVVVGFLALFKDLGTSAAIIQLQTLSDELISSVFWLNVFFGLLVTIVIYLASPWVADFYAEPRVIPVMRVLSLTFFLSGLSILHQTLLQRDLVFQTITKVELIATSAGAIMGIGVAFAKGGVWSLVLQTLTVTLMTTVLLWLFFPLRLKWNFRWVDLRPISFYSLNLLGFNIFNYFARNADYLLIGKFLGTHALGLYSLAYRIMLYPLQNISAVLGRVIFPAFSRVQDDNTKVGRGFLKVASGISLITFPMMMGLIALAHPFVMTVFGHQWEPVTILLMILAPVGMIQSIVSPLGAIYQAKGRTDLFFLWGVGAGTLVILAFIIGLRWGIVGVATAYAVASLILLYPGFAISFHIIKLKIRKLVGVLWRPLLSSLIMLGLIFLARTVLLSIHIGYIWQLALLVPLGSIIYFVAIWLLDRPLVMEILGLIRGKA